MLQVDEKRPNVITYENDNKKNSNSQICRKCDMERNEEFLLNPNSLDL